MVMVEFVIFAHLIPTGFIAHCLYTCTYRRIRVHNFLKDSLQHDKEHRDYVPVNKAKKLNTAKHTYLIKLITNL